MKLKENLDLILSSIFAVAGFFILSIIFNPLGMYFGFQARKKGKSTIPFYLNLFVFIIYIVSLFVEKVYLSTIWI